MVVKNEPSLSAFTIFQAAIVLPEGSVRQQFLDAACHANPELRVEVQQLLATDEAKPQKMLDRVARKLMTDGSIGVRSSQRSDEGKTPVDNQPDETMAIDGLPQVDDEHQPRIGAYQLIEKIGEGGMGIVYLAKQTEPVRRKVALKVIKPGMASREVLARFESERQALAMMDHPCIARVFDGGTTDSGQSFFAMELVQGTPINQFCDDTRLSTRERLELVRDVCRAVQHAHQKGIIHRDLKPSNVLVAEIDGRAVPKVIDFGVAKATSPGIMDDAICTRFSQMVGTPLYMSPEQASLGVVDVDTRSDVYSLGVLLYELLAGTTPFDREAFSQVSFDEMRRIVREDEPRRPSHQVSTLRGEALSTMADRRGVVPHRLATALRGELDWIVMRTLEKDRKRRYASAAELADDLERYLDDRVVQACPPSRRYRLGKFARRHRIALSMATSLTLVGVIGLGGTVWQLSRAMQAEEEAKTQADRAESEAAIAQAINEFLNEDILAQVNPLDEGSAGRDPRMSEVLDRAAQRLEGRFEDAPEIKAAIHRTMNIAYRTLDQSDKAINHAQSSWKLFRGVLGETDRKTIDALIHLAASFREAEQFARGEELSRNALRLCRETYGDEDEITIRAIQLLTSNLISQSFHQGVVGDGEHQIQADLKNRDGEALPLIKEGLELLAKLPEADFKRELTFILQKAGIAKRKGHFDEAETLLEQALVTSRGELGRSYKTFALMAELASVHHSRKNWARSEALQGDALEIAQGILGEESLTVAKLKGNLSASIYNQGRYEEAHRYAVDAYEAFRKQLPENAIPIQVAVDQLIRCNTQLAWKWVTTPGTDQETLRRGVQLARKSVELRPDDPALWRWLFGAEVTAGEYRQAIRSHARHEELQQKRNFDNELLLAIAFAKLGEYDEAKSRYCSGFTWVSARRKNSETSQRFLQRAEKVLGITDEARHEWLSEYFASEAFEYAWQWQSAGDWFKEQEQFDQSIDAYTAAIENSDDKDVSSTRRNRGYCFLHLGQFERAIADLSSVIETHPDDMYAVRLRTQAYAGLGETERAFQDVYAAAAANPNNHRIWEIWGRIIRRHYRPLGYDGVEREWRRTVEIAPTLPNAWFFTSAWLLLDNRTEEYHRMVQRVVEQSANLTGGQLAWANLLCALDPVAIEDSNEQRLRLELAERAIAEGPDWSQKHAAAIQVRCGQVEKGLATLQRLHEEEQADGGESPPLVALYLALAYEANGDSDAAEKAWQTAKSIDLEAIDTLSIQIEFEVLLHELRVQQGTAGKAVEAL